MWCVALNVNTCNNNLQHLQRVGRRGQTKKQRKETDSVWYIHIYVFVSMAPCSLVGERVLFYPEVKAVCSGEVL